MKNNYPCLICEEYQLVILKNFSSLPRVTSDSRPWPSGGHLCYCEKCGAVQKIPTNEWIEETEKIYQTYDLWPLANGIEQPIFTSKGKFNSRSNIIVDYLLKEYKFENKGELLDVGCGNGAALENFSTKFPQWNLYAADLTDRFLSSLKKIPLFKQLFIGSLENITQKFELIIMIHSLEHFKNPYEALCNIRNLLKDNGALFVAVPNANVSPFDYLVVDHIMHFSTQHIAYLGQRAGLSITHLREDILPKEISMIAEPSIKSNKYLFNGFDIQNSINRVREGVQWLNDLLVAANESSSNAKKRGSKFGIFGTSIAGMWIFGAMKEKVDFFVDEDTTRQGKFIEGRPIVAVNEIEKESYVFLALLPEAALNLHKRLNKNQVNWVMHS
jgi:SAM-dependent methyltransferase